MMEFDPSLAEKSFGEQADERSGLSADALVRVNVDLQRIAMFVLGMSAWLAEPEAQARFASLGEDVFDHGALARLPARAWAVWHAHRAGAKAAASSEAVVPVKVLEEMYDVRERMLSVLEYNTDIPDTLRLLRAGSGHPDLAGDLNELAGLYKTHLDEIAHDRKKYRAKDPARARALAATLLEAVARHRSNDEASWTDQRSRSFTLLSRDYEEVAAAGRFLWRKDRPEQRFPSLNVVGRAPRRVSDEETEEAAPTPKPSPDEG